MTVSTPSTSACDGSASLAIPRSLPRELPEQVRNQMVRVLGIADRYVTELDPELNFVARLNQLQTVLQWLQKSEQRDATPKLQVMPGTDGLTWIEFFRALHAHGERLHAQPDAITHIAAPSDVLPISEAIDRADALWHRLRVAVENNGSRPDVAAEQSALVFGNRRMPRSKAAWVTELGLKISAIESAENPPPALIAALPLLREEKRLMMLAADGRKPPPVTSFFSREIHVTSYAIDIALGEFLSWAAIHATPQRLNTFQRLIAPRHHADGTPVLPADPTSEPAVDEIIDPPPAEDETEEDETEEDETKEDGNKEDESEEMRLMSGKIDATSEKDDEAGDEAEASTTASTGRR